MQPGCGTPTILRVMRWPCRSVNRKLFPTDLTRMIRSNAWPTSWMAAALLGLLPLLAPAQLTRQANTTLNLPASLPSATGYTTANALGTLSFSSPIKLATLPGITNRLFVVERNNGIQMVNLDTMAKSTFLNLATYLTAQSTPLATDGESGFLGLAFHPNYNQNGYLFVFYSVTISGQRYERVARFQASGTAGNYNAATSVNTASHTPLITQLDMASNHNGGDLAFGPDGYLYFSAGDEGNQDDSFDNARHINKDFFGGIFRIDVDLKSGSLTPNAHTAINPGTYAVPPDNPFVSLPVDGSGNSTYNGFTFPHSTIRTEIWGIGFRNPWRMAFDMPTGRLFVGDVGQNTYEEVDVLTSGGFNGGWSWREGFHTHTPQPPTAEPPGFNPNPPIFEYDHTNDGVGNDSIIWGNAVIGGMYYRGSNYSDLYDSYIFGDNGSGIIAILRPNGSGGWTGSRLATDSQIVAFGTDPRNGDPLFCSFASNQVKTLVRSGTSGTQPPATLSATRAFSSLSTLTPNTGIVPYDPNVSFWSDYAIKSRWFSIKNLTDKITYNQDTPWVFPQGMVWVKHFDIETTRGDPSTSRKLETRFLVKTASDVYGITYRWRSDQSDADLVAENGFTDTLSQTVNGQPYSQTWRFPSRDECRVCHTQVGGFALSFNTRQMNHAHTYGAVSQNEIQALSDAGYFTAPVTGVVSLPSFAAATDTSQSLEWRVRSYLAVNCSQCHQPGGAALGNWDARPTTPTDSANLINGILVNNNNNSANRWAVPGDTTHSMVLLRQQGIGLPRMPPLATYELDTTDIQLVTDWINQALPTRQNFTQWQTAHFQSTTTANAQASADPDHDGQSNAEEYLAGTDPLNAASVWNYGTMTFDGTNVQFQFTQPANRSAVVEASSDLLNWHTWNAAGNTATFPASATVRTIITPVTATDRFFRVRFGEP
jgi:glucose/arabinose dehydrogenase/mono/diheme cytochrome c family protein